MRTTATNSLSGKPFCPASVTPVDVSPAARMLMSEGLNSPEREPDPYLWAGIPNGLAVLARNRVSRLGNGGWTVQTTGGTRTVHEGTSCVIGSRSPFQRASRHFRNALYPCFFARGYSVGALNPTGSGTAAIAHIRHLSSTMLVQGIAGEMTRGDSYRRVR